MSPRRLRIRLLDIAVASLCVACVGAPFIPLSEAVEATLGESGGDIDQRVLQAGVISYPLNGAFGGATSGTADGSTQWDLYSTAADGMKLVVQSDRSPALRDGANGIDIADLAAAPAPWSVASTDRRFGFTAMGPLSLSAYAGGDKWRGLSGTRSVELAREDKPSGRSRTTVRWRAEYAQPLAAGATPTANVFVTGVVNL